MGPQNCGDVDPGSRGLAFFTVLSFQENTSTHNTQMKGPRIALQKTRPIINLSFYQIHDVRKKTRDISKRDQNPKSNEPD